MFRNILSAILIIVVLFMGISYLWLLEEKESLNQALNIANREIKSLQSEREEYKKEILLEKEKSERFEQNLKELKEKLAAVNVIVDELNSKIKYLSEQNQNLLKNKDTLLREVNQLKEENTQLKNKISSLSELKKTIRELKLNLRRQGLNFKTKLKTTSSLPEGNFGYIIKNGKPTYSIKIRVIPQE